MSRITVLAILVLPIVGAPLAAQATPNFTGTWIAAKTPAWMTRTANGNPDLETEFIIKQSVSVLSSTVKVVSKSTGKDIGRPQPPTIFYLDGHAVPKKQFDGTIVTTRTTWDGPSLVITVTTSQTGRPVRTRVTRWSLSAEGQIVVDDGPDTPASELMILKRK